MTRRERFREWWRLTAYKRHNASLWAFAVFLLLDVVGLGVFVLFMIARTITCQVMHQGQGTAQTYRLGEGCVVRVVEEKWIQAKKAP